jgi:hypothetical protein
VSSDLLHELGPALPADAVVVDRATVENHSRGGSAAVDTFLPSWRGEGRDAHRSGLAELGCCTTSPSGLP